LRDEMAWEGSSVAAMVAERLGQLGAELEPPRLDEATLGQRFDAIKEALARQRVRRRRLMAFAQWLAVVMLIVLALAFSR
jgi:hypothetical protein